MTGTVPRRWTGVPPGVRRTVQAAVALFAFGTGVHVAHLVVGGVDPYPAVPGWLAAYFVSLTVLDPAAALLLARRRRAGLVLGCAVLVTDAAANLYANLVVDGSDGLTVGRVGAAVVAALAVALIAVSPRLWPWLGPVTPRAALPG